jgi:hypothetical protein
MKKSIVLIFISLITLSVIAQKESNLLKKHEISLLRILLSDSVNNTSFMLSNTFDFGLDNQLFTNSNIIKKGKDVYIQPLGTGRLYKAYNINNDIKVARIDETIHSGVNFYAQNFFINMTNPSVYRCALWRAFRSIHSTWKPKRLCFKSTNACKTRAKALSNPAAVHRLQAPSGLGGLGRGGLLVWICTMAFSMSP